MLSKENPTQVFPCERCEIFKNNYFEEHPPTAASKVRINQKWNFRKQVFCKTDFLKYSLKAWNYNTFHVKSHMKNLYSGLFFNEGTRFETTNTKAWKLCTFCIN